MDNTLKSILYADPIKNIATAGFFSNYNLQEFHIENNSAILFGTSDHLWAHIVSNSEIDTEQLLAKYYAVTKFYYSVEDWQLPLISKYGKPEWIMATNRYILKNDVDIPVSKNTFISLNELHAEAIYSNSNYKQYTSIQYINDRLKKDISVGIIENHNLVAWGFTHDDGALGFLHVLDQYRKKGYGKDILLKLIALKRKKDKPVFCNIVPDNEKAIRLVTQLGFEFDRKVSWVKLI